MRSLLCLVQIRLLDELQYWPTHNKGVPSQTWYRVDTSSTKSWQPLQRYSEVKYYAQNLRNESWRWSCSNRCAWPRRFLETPLPFCYHFASSSTLHSYPSEPTVTSIASPGLKLSKSMFFRALSAASIDSCRIREFALLLSEISSSPPLVRLFQFNVIRIWFDIEGQRANVIWRPFLRNGFGSSRSTCKIGCKRPGNGSRNTPY